MAINNDKPSQWKADIALSVDMYNDWFIRFAPKTFRDTRIETTKDVEQAFRSTENLTQLSPGFLATNASVLPTLRMCTCPPIAVDRLVGLSGSSKNLIMQMEKKGRTPPKMQGKDLTDQLARISKTIAKLLDKDIFVWIEQKSNPSKNEIYRAATIVADRLCGSYSDPIIRNAQEARQLKRIAEWLKAQGYKEARPKSGDTYLEMAPGSFAFRLNVKVPVATGTKTVNIPIDAVIMPKSAKKGDYPIFVEAKSAGDFTNPNKRRKEEAKKMDQLKSQVGGGVRFVLFLCGYFDSGYLGYEAAEGIDWVWEHRIDDLAQLGL